MASERQIAANRLNARNSTGPRTEAGKKRASRNALRHGLASQALHVMDAERGEQLARQIAGDSKKRIVLELARSAAAAELNLAWALQIQADLIRSSIDEDGWLVPEEQWAARLPRVKPRSAKLVNPLPAMPSEDSERTVEARRILTELRKIDRYERRAAGRRDSAIRKMNEQIMG